MIRKLQTLPLDDVSNKLKHFHFKLINYGTIQLEANMKTNKRFLPHYRIFVASKGSFELRRNTLHYPLNTHDLVMILPNTLYSALCKETSGCFFYLDFTFDNIQDEKEFNELFRIQDICLFKNLLTDRQMDNLAHLDQTVQINYPGTYLLVESMLYRILIVMLKRMLEEEHTFTIHNPDNAKERLVLACCQYIDEHLNETITVRQLSKALNYSENYIYKAFNDTLKISCKSYINDYRLLRGLQDLKATTLSVSEIAQRNGFSTVYHFSNAFKKKYGYSPLNYRKAMEK